jgi:hypothetical protein
MKIESINKTIAINIAFTGSTILSLKTNIHSGNIEYNMDPCKKYIEKESRAIGFKNTGCFL